MDNYEWMSAAWRDSVKPLRAIIIGNLHLLVGLFFINLTGHSEKIWNELQESVHDGANLGKGMATVWAKKLYQDFVFLSFLRSKNLTERRDRQQNLLPLGTGENSLQLGVENGGKVPTSGGRQEYVWHQQLSPRDRQEKGEAHAPDTHGHSAYLKLRLNQNNRNTPNTLPAKLTSCR